MSPSADSLNRLGAELQLQGDEEGARLHYLAALHIDPGFCPSLANLAMVLGNQNKLTVAAAIVTRILNMFPNDGGQWNNLGNFLTRLERYSEAEIALNRAAELVPDNIGVWHNLLLLAHRTRRSDLALDYVNQVIRLGGFNPSVQNDRAHILLAIGDLGRGLVDYEARWHTLLHLEPWDFHIPEWTGQDLTGKSILVHHEQGFGDTIMASRFVLSVRDLGAKVTFGLPVALLRLYEHQDWGIEFIDITKLTQENAREFDFHSPLYSTMRWLGIRRGTISSTPYLTSPELVVPGVIKNVFNVGICWTSGSRGSKFDWRRRISPLEAWLSLTEIPGVLLWSINKDPSAQEEIQTLGAEALIHDQTGSFNDFASAAAFISKLDLVISVDTAVVHLAGAMGKPVWMLNQFTPCWRWWDSDIRAGTPWYENMKIVNQNSPGDWGYQIAECKTRLLNLIQRPRQDSAA